MDLLSRLEHALEDAFEGVFSRTFRTKLHPIEIARRLSRAVDSHRTLSVSAIYVPNEYTVRLAPEDYQELQRISVRLLGELEGYLRDYVTERGYQLIGPLAIHLAEDHDIKAGDMVIACDNNANATPHGIPAPTAHTAPATADIEHTALISMPPTTLEIVTGEAAGRTIALSNNPSIGRGPANSIAFAETSISRHHATIVLEDEGWKLRDLGSTNGTYVNGRRITEHLLQIGDTIGMGNVVMKVK